MVSAHYVRISPVPKGSFSLFGLRGVGKSTWVRDHFPDAHIVDLLDEAGLQTLTANPGLLAAELASLPQGRTVVLDEAGF
jgi:hypothetical protein